MNKNPVLLLGLFDTAIMTARSLKGNRIPIYGWDYDTSYLGFWSRYIRSSVISNPRLDEIEWINEIVEKIKKFNLKVIIIPTSDEFVWLLSKYKELLQQHALFILPEHDTIYNILERNRQFDSARGCGIDVPTFHIGPFESFHPKDYLMSFPVAIKPANSVEWSNCFRSKGFLAYEQSELDAYLKLVNNKNVRYLIQEVIPGENQNNFEVNSIYLPDRSLIQHSIRKIRQYPDKFGTATCIETCSNPIIETLAGKLVRCMNIYGFSNIEFKFDARRNKYYLIEVNTRVWLQVNFTNRIGLNFPMVYYNYLLNNPISNSYTKLSKGKWINPGPDLLFFLKYRRDKKLTFKNWISDWFPIRSFGLFSLCDPIPFLKEYKYGFRLLNIFKS